MTNRTHTIHRNITGTCPTLINTWKTVKLQNSILRMWQIVKKLNSKSDACVKNWFEIWRFENFSNQNLTRCKNFQCKIWQVKISCQNLMRCNNFKSNSDALLKSWMEFWRVVKGSVQNLTRCQTFSTKSDFWNVFQVLTGGSYLLTKLIHTCCNVRCKI